MPRTRTSWKSGQSGNLRGRPRTGMQSFKDRLAYWLEHKTLGDIQTIVSDPKQFGRLPSADAMVAQRIYRACQAKGRVDFVAVLDRLLGKPALMAELNVTHGLADRLDRAEVRLGRSPTGVKADDAKEKAVF